MRKKLAAIIDPYSAGRLLAPEFVAKGYRCLRVQSTPTIPQVFAKSLDETHFEGTVIHEGDLEITAQKLRSLGVDCVIPGVETGVELADSLSEKLGLATNGTKLSAARRNKFLMAEALRAQGVRHIPHLKSDNLEEALEWIRENNYLPAVFKPLNSAGSDSVYICETEEQVREAFVKIFGTKNKLDLLNAHVLIQAYISGTEYVVDTVSCQGEHFVTDIWRYKKFPVNGAAFVYDAEELLDPKDKISVELTAYMLKVLEALGIQYGPVHAEIFMDDQGPVLVEAGARVAGGDTSLIVQASTNQSQADLTVEAYFAPEKLLARNCRSYERKKCAILVYFISIEEGILKDWPRLHEIESLPTLFSRDKYIQPGEALVKTIDLFTHPGRATIIDRDPRLLWQHYERIREIDANGLFSVVKTSR